MADALTPYPEVNLVLRDLLPGVRAVLGDQFAGMYLTGSLAAGDFDRGNAMHANIDRGRGERLKMVEFDEGVVQSHLLRERGIALEGPDPRTLIDSVTPGDLRNAMRRVLEGWPSGILDDPVRIRAQGYQSYTVLSMCRILYTHQSGTVVSKPVAAKWARETLGDPWAPLIDRAWIGRQHPELTASSEDIDGTLALIRESLHRVRSG